jgi:FkbM family methyltransferase
VTRAAKKMLRTAQIHFPGWVDTKFAVMRMYRKTLRRPFEDDFNALALFPPMDGVYLDVGANRGQSTDAILMRRPGARVHLFEPNRILFEKLLRLFGHNQDLRLHNVGLGDEPLVADLNVPVYNGWMFDGLGSFDRGEAQDWLRPRMYFYQEQKLRVERMPCHVVTLDSFGLNPFFVKLDIQGFELKALKGGAETLQRCEPVVLTESPDDETVEYLGSLGYDFFAYREGKFIQRAIGAPNTFFLTPSRARLVEQHITHRTGEVLRF